MKISKDILELEKALIQLNSTQMGRRLFLTSLPLLVSSCALTPTGKERYREGDNSGQKSEISVQDEIKMSNEYAPQMAKDYPPVQNPDLQKYLTGIGNRIVEANQLKNNPYQYEFTLVQSKAVNAFALPAGKVYVTTPLVAMASTEAELAGVVGHEIGHIKARHTAERMTKAKSEESKGILYGIGGALGGALLGAGLGQILCSKKDRECMERVTKYGAAAGAFGGLLIQKYAFMAHSREDEMEADRVGFKTSVAAGYSKDHVGLFYEKLLIMEQKHKSGSGGVLAGLTDAMSTHPPSKERVAQMQEMSRTTSQQSSVVSTNEFSNIQELIKKSYL